jgi:uncharacterized protein YcgI (DUF1989 family)
MLRTPHLHYSTHKYHPSQFYVSPSQAYLVVHVAILTPVRVPTYDQLQRPHITKIHAAHFISHSVKDSWPNMVFPDIQDVQSMSPDAISGPKTHICKAAHGLAFEVKKGERFRVVDLHGEQVVDFAAWVQGTDLVEKLSMAYTRFHLNGVTPAVGEYLWTNNDEPILKLVEDTVKVHDMTFMSCFPKMYEKEGRPGHRSCASNIAEAMEPYGMKSHLDVTDPFNIFQNTPNYSLKRLGSSKAGDFVEFEAMQDCICACSSCPYDAKGFNGGKITDIAVVTGIPAKS